LLLIVLGTGLEPVQPNGHWILSPTCLPIPPPEPGSHLSGELSKKTPRLAQRFRAKNGIRTRDLNLGKVALYQLSYFRKLSIIPIKLGFQEDRKFITFKRILKNPS
jgi:hypothetical protein